MTQHCRVWMLVAVVGLAACGSDSGAEPSSEPMAGSINGQPFAFVAGETNAFLSEGEDTFFSDLFGETYTACGFSTPRSPHIIASIPKEPGDYGLSLKRNMTFTYDDGEDIQNLVGTRGRLIVDEVTATSVSGRMHAIYNDDNEVDGAFSLTICTDD